MSVKTGEQKLRIGIVGTGAAGLAALKVFRDTPQFRSGHWTAAAFEAREDVGGVWLPASPTDDVPPTPLYDSLTTNLPHPIMCFRSLLFPPSTPLFPVASFVEKYLRSFAEKFELMQHIHLKSSVKKVTWSGSSWLVNVSSSNETYEFDRLIVANGHYHVPYYPDIPGLNEWLQSGKAKHSVWYRHAQYLGDVVLVVGGGPSGQDITDEISQVTPLVIHSVPDANAQSEAHNVRRRGRVVRLTADGTAHFEDGTLESSIDYCILATGYVISFPFFDDDVMRMSMPDPVPPLPQHLHNSSMHVFPLTRELFPIQADYPPSSLAFMGLPVRVIPFPLFEAQARAILKVFSDPSRLDIPKESADIISRYKTLRDELSSTGDETPGSNIEQKIAHAWHLMKNYEQFEYRDMLHALAGLNGPEWRVAAWEKEIFASGKSKLRQEWKALEKSGEGEDWVKGVGEGSDPLQEWLDLMRRLLKRSEAFDTPLSVTEETATRL